jgi:methylphosphotriester-DNA--protein-cysteine methyltransferase
LQALDEAAARRVALEEALAEARDETHARIVDALRANQAEGRNGISEIARRARYDREHVRRIRKEAGLDPFEQEQAC